MTILYDSKCDFCTCFIRFVEKKKKAGVHVETYDLRTIEARRALKKKNVNFINLNTIYLVDDCVLMKSQAALKILTKMRLPYNLLRIVSVLPNTITDHLYDFVAKHRYKISKFIGVNNAHKM